MTEFQTGQIFGTIVGLLIEFNIGIQLANYLRNKKK